MSEQNKNNKEILLYYPLLHWEMLDKTYSMHKCVGTIVCISSVVKTVSLLYSRCLVVIHFTQGTRHDTVVPTQYAY